VGWIREAELEYRRKLTAVTNVDVSLPILNALISERATNVRFCSPLLNSLTNDTLVDAYKEHMRRSEDKKYTLAVYTQPIKPVEVSENMEVVYAPFSTATPVKDSLVKSSAKVDLPIAHQEQLAMLGMMESGSYLPNVGYRATDYIYYLY
jgi:hypothetical protein